MASQGPLSPGTVANDSALGTLAWTNPGNASASDNVYATAAPSSQSLQLLKATNFGFSIPTGATIDGIVCEFEGKHSAGSRFMDTYIVNAGSKVDASINGGLEFTTTEAYKSLGSISDLWDAAWTAADINSSGFGVATHFANATTGTFSVDHIRITVYYTPPPPEITSVTPSVVRDGDTGVIVAGTDFGASQGSGGVVLSPTNDIDDVAAEEQTVTAWGDTGITFTVVLGAMTSPSAYLFVRTNDAQESTGFAVVLGPDIATVTPTIIYNGLTGVAIAGIAFGATTGTVLLSPTDDPDDLDAEAQAVTAWANGEIEITVVQGGLSAGAVYLIVITDDAEASPGAAVTLWVVAEVGPTLQWANGGAALQQSTLQWANGGRASQARTLQWRVAPSPLRVHYALTGRSGPVSYAFRFERRTIANQFLQDVTPAVLAAAIEANNDRDVFRTGTFTIDASATDDRGNAVTIDPLADHIAVFMDLLVDGSYTLGLPMGLFALNVPRKRFEPGWESWEVTASDNAIHLMESTTTASYTVAAAVNYVTGANAVKAILDDLGLSHALPNTSLTLPVSRTWPAGTPWLRIVNDLLHAAGMYSLWFDASGIARTRAYDDLSTRTPDVTYTGDDFVLIPITEEAETTRLANQVVAVVDDPSRAVLTSVKTNADPDSPISTVTLGRTITRVIQSDAADQTTLDAIAENYLRNEAGLYRRGTLLTSIDPRRDAREVYELTVDGVYAAERWWARNWRVQLAIGAQQQHTLGKVERVAAS